MKDFIAGTVANYIVLSIPTPSQGAIDEILKIIAAGLVSYAMASLRAKRAARKTKKDDQ